MVLEKVALTGASGMTGRHFIDVLCEQGIEVVATSRSACAIKGSKVEWSKWDLKKWLPNHELDAIFKNSQAIFHLGAYVPTSFNDSSFQIIMDVNVRACACLAEWALNRNIPFVYISSSTVYADPYRKGIKEHFKKSTGEFGGFYGYSKLLAEQTLQYFAEKGLKLIILRPSSIYGSGLNKEKLVAKMLYNAQANLAIELAPPINESFNLIHARDLASAALDAVYNSAYGVYNIGYNKSYSLIEIAKNAIEIANSGKLILPHAEQRDKTRTLFDLDCKKAVETFDYKPAIDLRTGMFEMYKSQILQVDHE
ncbi:MAG TPA: NAD(P)-dependent oxidoreductase [Desulfuromonadaceae bacterium]|jgi:nucleoside-diphosphate-sugar epimerase